MLSEMPIKMEKAAAENLDLEILRAAIIAELDAINLYEQFALTTENEELKKVLLEVAREEKPMLANFKLCFSKWTENRLRNWRKAKEKLKN